MFKFDQPCPYLAQRGGGEGVKEGMEGSIEKKISLLFTPQSWRNLCYALALAFTCKHFTPDRYYCQLYEHDEWSIRLPNLHSVIVPEEDDSLKYFF